MRASWFRLGVFLIGFVVLLPPLSSGLPAAFGKEKTVFSTLTFDQALVQAEKEKKLVFVDFFTTWCGPCKMLDNTTWRDPKVIQWLSKHTVPLKVDAEKEVELAKRYRVEAYPTMAFIKPDGTLLDSIVGFCPPEKFLSVATAYLSGKDSLTLARENLKGHEDDPQRRMQYAKVLAEKGQFEKALEEYLWCYDNGLKDPAFFGVRNSFLLSYIARLGKQHPPAKSALLQRRDEREKKVLSGTDGKRDLDEVLAINEAIGDEEGTLRLFNGLSGGDEKAKAKRGRMVDNVLELLIKARRYPEILELVPDPVGKMDAAARDHERFMEGLQQEKTDPKFIEEASGSLKRLAIRPSCYSFEALASTKGNSEALKLGERILAFDNSADTHQYLIEAAIRAGNREVALAIAERGKKLASPEERAKVEAAAKKVPVE